jgi:hypothetical protein
MYDDEFKKFVFAFLPSTGGLEPVINPLFASLAAKAAGRGILAKLCYTKTV